MHDSQETPPSQGLWCRVTTIDPEGLSGESVANFVRFATNLAGVSYVTLSGEQWLSEVLGVSPIPSGRESVIITDVPNLLRGLPQVIGVDFVDFFFHHSEEAAQQIMYEDRMRDSIPKSVLSISCLDLTYFYLYTQDETLARAVADAYSNDEPEIEQNYLSAPEFTMT